MFLPEVLVLLTLLNFFQIPFSKFIFSSKGRLQDKQYRIPLDRISHFGIACGDKVDGRFDLEIEYIGEKNFKLIH